MLFMFISYVFLLYIFYDVVFAHWRPMCGVPSLLVWRAGIFYILYLCLSGFSESYNASASSSALWVNIDAFCWVTFADTKKF